MSYLILSDTEYVAPRVEERPRCGRSIREASCGHDVYLSPRGLEAVDHHHKRLLCGPCANALAREKGWRLGVWFPGDEEL